MRSPAHIALAALVLCASASARVESPAQARLVSLLAEPVENAEQVDTLARSLAELGADTSMTLVEALADGFLDPPASSGAAPTASKRIDLDPLRRAAVLQSFAFVSGSGLRERLAALRTRDSRAASRRAALEVYGVIAIADDLAAMIAMASPEVPDEPIAPTLRRALAEALESLLGRDASTVGHVPRSFSAAHPSLRAVLIEGLETMGSGEALGVLTGLCGSGPELDLLCLSAIAGLARRLEEREDARALDVVRGYLSSRDPRLVQAAVRASGELRDAGAVPHWIRLMASTDANLVAAAERALEETSGRQLGTEREAWEAWYEAELDWWQRSQTRMLEGLKSNTAVDHVETLNAAGEHRLFRRELELDLVRHASARDPLVAAMACSVLGRIGSRAGIATLRELVTSDATEPRVATAALYALERILGELVRP